MLFARLKPHLYYLTSKTSEEIIRDFKSSFILFEILFSCLLIGFAVLTFYTQYVFYIKNLILFFIILTFIFGTTILPKINDVAKLLNEKGVIVISPGVLIALQCIMNLFFFTSAIIPIFLWIKCTEIERRIQAKKDALTQ